MLFLINNFIEPEKLLRGAAANEVHIIYIFNSAMYFSPTSALYHLDNSVQPHTVK